MSRLALSCALPPVLTAVLYTILTTGTQAYSGPPRLALSTRTVELGALEPGEIRAVDLPWRRLGAGPLRILAVRAGCGCVVVTAPEAPLPSGAEGSITLRFQARSAAGPLAQRVRIFTDARPPHDLLTCRLLGFVGSPVACTPARLDLGRCSPGRRVERTVEVRWAAAAGIANARDLELAMRGVRGTAVLRPPARRDVAGGLLQLALDLPRTQGPFTGEVLLSVAGRPLTSLPVVGRVVPCSR